MHPFVIEDSIAAFGYVHESRVIILKLNESNSPEIQIIVIYSRSLLLQILSTAYSLIFSSPYHTITIIRRNALLLVLRD
jgi:hypothetical protein